MRLIDADALKIRIQDGPAMMFVGDVLEMIDEAPEVETDLYVLLDQIDMLKRGMLEMAMEMAEGKDDAD